jgi:hypothetical protein
MGYRYSSLGYGSKDVSYGLTPFVRMIEIKSGEVQIIRLNYRSEIENQVYSYDCPKDYDIIENIQTPEITAIKTQNNSQITVSVVDQSTFGEPFSALDGTVALEVGLLDVNIRYGDAWQVSVSVDLEDGRRLTQDFRVRAVKAANPHQQVNYIQTISQGSSDLSQNLKSFDIVNVTADVSLSQSQFTQSDNTLGISANPSIQDITITIPSGLQDGTELIVESVDNQNSVFVVVNGGVETIAQDPTGVEIDRDGGVTIKKNGDNWELFGKYIST